MRASWWTLLAALAVACDSGGMGGPGPQGGGPADAGADAGTGGGQMPPGASTSVPVSSVPGINACGALRRATRAHRPPGLRHRRLARVPGARFMAVTPEGNLLVSNPGAGTVSLVRSGTGGAAAVVSDWVTGLRKPHDLVFHTIGSTVWLYDSESNGVRRYAWNGAPPRRRPR